MITHAVPPYQIDGIVIEKVIMNYSYGKCYVCQQPSLPDIPSVHSLKNPPKLTCQKVTFTFREHHTVYFDFNKAKLRNDEKQNLIGWLKKLPKGTKFTVIGYTDKVGTRNYNNALARKRAEAVASFIKKFFPNSDIKVKAQGKCCYRSEKNCLNRRVEITATKTFEYKPNPEVSK